MTFDCSRAFNSFLISYSRVSQFLHLAKEKKQQQKKQQQKKKKNKQT